MAFPEILRTPANQEESFPGVPAWRMDIAPVKVAPHLSPKTTNFLLNLIKQSNSLFDDLARPMIPGESNDYLTIHSTGETAKTLAHKTAEAVYEVTSDIPNAQLVFFPAGAIPIATDIRFMGYPVKRMHALDISGSVGTESGFATVNGTIAPELLDPSNNIIIPEDIMDSIDTLFQFIQVRGLNRDTSQQHTLWLKALGERIQTAHANGNNDPAAYADFARAAAEEHVAILSIWSKNEQARQAITKQAEIRSPNESWVQKNLIECYPITPLPSNLWVLGGNYTMDTGILWSRIKKQLPDRLQHDPRITKYIGPNGEWLVRAGRIKALAYLETKNQVENVIRSIAHLATQTLGES